MQTPAAVVGLDIRAAVPILGGHRDRVRGIDPRMPAPPKMADLQARPGVHDGPAVPPPLSMTSIRGPIARSADRRARIDG
jgi:hypothetical protein